MTVPKHHLLENKFLNALKKGTEDLLLECIQQGVNINFNNEEALNYVVVNNKPELLKFLIQQKNLTLNNIENIFKYSVDNEYQEITEILIHHGFNPNYNNGWAVEKVIHRDNLSMFKMLEKYISVKKNQTKYAESGLMHGSLKILNYLMANGLNIKEVLKDEGSVFYQLYPKRTINFLQNLNLKQKTKNNKKKKIKAL